MIKSSSVGHSAKVQIILQVNGQQLRVAQVGRDSLILRDSHEAAPGSRALLSMTIDQRTSSREIKLTDGIAAGVQLVSYVGRA